MRTPRAPTHAALRGARAAMTTLAAAAALAACGDPATAPSDASRTTPSAAAAAAARARGLDVAVLDLGSNWVPAAIADNGRIAGSVRAGRSPYDPYGDTFHAAVWDRGVLTDLGTAGALESGATGISASGLVIGFNRGIDGRLSALLWENGVATVLPPLPGARGAAATAISPDGKLIAGYSETTYAPAGTPVRAVLWRDGQVVDLGTLGGTYSYALGVNARGQVVGRSALAAGSDVTHAFLWEAGVMTDLGALSAGQSSGAFAINARGQVVGYSTVGYGGRRRHPFLWQNGVMTDLGTLGSNFGDIDAATAINARGQVVGLSSTLVGPIFAHAFLWEDGVMTDLGTLGGPHGFGPDVSTSGAVGINDAGRIVGSASTASAPYERHAVLWRVH